MSLCRLRGRLFMQRVNLKKLPDPSNTYSLRWLIFALAASLFLLSQFYRVSNAVIAPELIADLSLDTKSIGLMSAAFFYAFALTQIPISLLLDKVGPRRMMTVLSAIGVLGAIIYSMAETPAAVIGDGHLGIWAALREVYPHSLEQRCWNHKMVNVLDKLPRKVHREARTRLREMMYADGRAVCETRRDEFLAWCRARQWPAAAETLQRDWERLVTFYQLPREHWVHLRTSNIVESPFAAVRLRTDAAKRFKRVDNATAAIWKMLMVGQLRFKPLVRPELLPLVLRGVRCRDGQLPLLRDADETAA